MRECRKLSCPLSSETESEGGEGGETERISKEEGDRGTEEGRGRGARPEGSRLQHISALFALH